MFKTTLNSGKLTIEIDLMRVTTRCKACGNAIFGPPRHIPDEVLVELGKVIRQYTHPVVKDNEIISGISVGVLGD